MRSAHVFFPIFSIVFILLIDVYLQKSLLLIFKSQKEQVKVVISSFHWSIPAIIIISLLLILIKGPSLASLKSTYYTQWVLTLILVIYIPKLLFAGFHFMEDILRFIHRLSNLGFLGVFTKKLWLTKMGIILSFISLLAMFYGISKGISNFKVTEERVLFTNLPEEFNRFRIIHISDLHLGSFYNRENILSAGIKKINEQNADILVVTGDFVNQSSKELNYFSKYIACIKPEIRKYAVLGNHDYGQYARWETSAEQKKDQKALIKELQSLDIHVLLNDSDVIKRHGDSIAIIGVENWGNPPFPQYGNIKKAMANVEKVPFKILLSHDPSHWREKVLNETDIDLTLSGHTHGMQLGLNIGKWRWSPVQYKYPDWQGLYQNGKQKLYVNVGFGFIGFAGRLGMPPEISIIELQKEP